MSKKFAVRSRKSIQEVFQEKLAKQNRVPSTQGDAVKYLLENEHIVDQQDDDGDSPLMNAVDSGCLESVKILLSRKANVNVQSASGATALHIASSYRDATNTEITRLLMQAGARTDICNRMGSTAIAQAQGLGHSELVGVMSQCASKPGPITQKA